MTNQKKPRGTFLKERNDMTNRLQDCAMCQQSMVKLKNSKKKKILTNNTGQRGK